MIDIKRLTPLIAIVGALALATSAPAYAQAADTSAAPAAPSAAAPADSAAPADRALLETERSPRKKFLPGDEKAATVSTPRKTRNTASALEN